jgi:transposase
MSQIKKTVCGADIHKRFLVATIISRDGLKHQERFGTQFEDLLKFRDWIIEKGCHGVAVESTGSYWYPIYAVMEGKVEFVLANAYQIKHIPGKKTDMADSEWIAELYLNDLIKPSRIFSSDYRSLRSLTRGKEVLIKARTQLKNRVHKILDSCCIKLSSVVSDIFGKSGRHIVEGLLKGQSLDDIISEIPSRQIRNKKDQLVEAIKTNLTLEQHQIFQIQSLLNAIDAISNEIEETNREIRRKSSNLKEDLRIVLSMPGMGFASASVILSEIGDYRDFSTSEQIAAYFGIVPSVYQSADHLNTGSITKHGSPHLRRMLVEVAHAIVRSRKDSKLKKFFLKVKARRGAKVAIVALARKVLCILHHLLIHREEYHEDGFLRPKCFKRECGHVREMSLEEMIGVLSRAGYMVERTIQDKAKEHIPDT